MTIPEERQGAALRRLGDALDRRREIDAEIHAASLEARDSGLSIERIRSFAGVSRDTVYGWIRAAGGEIGRKLPGSPAAKKATTSRAKRTAHG